MAHSRPHPGLNFDYLQRSHCSWLYCSTRASSINWPVNRQALTA